MTHPKEPERVEIDRRDVSDKLNPAMTIACPECGATHTLFFNGGELDHWWHCGRYFVLEHARIDLVTYSEPEKPPWT